MTGQGDDVEVPVLIIGGSLVGLSTALLLALHGVGPLVVERHSGTAIHPRAVFAEPGDEKLPHQHPRDSQGRPGSRAPHVFLDRRGERISTLDLFGRNFVLLAGAGGAGWQGPALAAARRLGIELDAYQVDDAGAGGELTDPDARFRAAYGISPGGAVLVRPDGFIAWRAADARGATADRVAGVLSRVLCRADVAGQPPSASEILMVAPVAEDDEGGDPVCWAHMVCEECGAITTEGHRPGCSREAATAD